MTHSEVKVRKYPYPYKAALAISNDVDLTTWSAFREWHDFVNGRSETRYGHGLGLEVTDSFWFWSHLGHVALFHGSPFESPRKSPEHDEILELVRLGLIDTLHGFGEWKESKGVQREDLLRALDVLVSRDAVPRVYSNHGGLNMAHNMGGVWGYYQGGDDPTHYSYCLDALDDAGVRYYWTDVSFDNVKFGNDYARDLEGVPQGVNQWFRMRGADAESATAAAVDALHCSDEDEARRLVWDRPLLRTRMRDGRDVWLFKRFRGEYPPDSGCFAHQVSSARLDALESNGGVAIVYQHMGVWRPLGAGKDKDVGRAKRASISPVLDEHAVWAFRRIASRYDSGRILVAGTSRLLEYLWVRDHLEFDVAQESSALVITLRWVNCPIRGRQPVTEGLAQGLSFCSPVGDEPIVIRTSDGRDLTTVSDVDDHDGTTGQRVTFVPWRSLRYPFA